MQVEKRLSSRAAGFTESVIREMTRKANATGAINLAQGFPDFAAPEALKEAACRAIRDDHNQYAITWGSQRLREALAAKVARYNRMDFDPETEVTVGCGSTEAMIASMLALVDPGDEVVVMEPFYENYGPDTAIAGATPVFVRSGAGFAIDEDALGSRIRPEDQGDRPEYPQQSDGPVYTPWRAPGNRRPLYRPRCLRVRRRDLRAHPVRRTPPPLARFPPGDGGQDSHDRIILQDLFRDRMARRVRPRRPETERGHPEGPRLSHRRRSGTAAGGVCGGARIPGCVLRRPGGPLRPKASAPPRRAGRRPGYRVPRRKARTTSSATSRGSTPTT